MGTIVIHSRAPSVLLKSKGRSQKMLLKRLSSGLKIILVQRRESSRRSRNLLKVLPCLFSRPWEVVRVVCLVVCPVVCPEVCPVVCPAVCLVHLLVEHQLQRIPT